VGLFERCVQSVRESAVTRRVLAGSLAGLLLVGAVGMTARARTPTAPEPAPVAPTVRPAPVPANAGLSPVLTHGPAQAVLTPDRPTVISLTGEHVAPGVTVTLESTWYIYTFGRESLSAQTSRGLDLAIVDVQPGLYTVTLCNPDGRRSAPLKLVLKTP
jgi:hypothetical protein